MDVKEAIDKRRAYRSLDAVEITEELVKDLAASASLAPSCNNFHPWRYVFVFEKIQLERMHEALPVGNQWAKAASMIVAVLGRKDDDCVIKDREYYLFDTGMATAFLILRATELGLVAHPIAGYSPETVREVLGIPDDYNVITLVNVGKHSDKISPILSEKQVLGEKQRPPRKSFEEFAHFNRYSGK